MSKKGMQLKYKSPKRDKNKKKEEYSAKKEFISGVKTFIGIIVFLGLAYAGMLGMKALGVFEKGYTAPTKEEVEFSSENIAIGTVFNRPESSYYVLFDNYKDNYSNDPYINTLVSNIEDTKVYKVDMSKPENAKFVSEESNEKATTDSELKINGLTLIKIKKGKIEKYVTGSDKIEEYLSK